MIEAGFLKFLVVMKFRTALTTQPIPKILLFWGMHSPNFSIFRGVQFSIYRCFRKSKLCKVLHIYKLYKVCYS